MHRRTTFSIRMTVNVVALALLATACGSSASTASTTTRPAAIGTPAPGTGPVASAPVAGNPASSPASTSASAAPATSGGAATTAGGGAVKPNAPEVVAPGDIPDNQAFVAYQPAGGIYSVKVPEGWARTETGGVVTFTDHYNSITLTTMPATAAPTVATVKAQLQDVATDPTFTLTDVTKATRPAGDAVLATYEIGSAPDPVTGKKALLAVERYVFFHNGTDVIVTLSGAKGADNIDPWKTVTTSLAWT